MMNLMVKRVAEDDAANGEGLTLEELVEWYLHQKEEDLHSIQAYHEERALAFKVLKRLVKDKILMSITSTADNGLPIQSSESDANAGTARAVPTAPNMPSKTVYIIHPNCAILDFFDAQNREEATQQEEQS